MSFEDLHRPLSAAGFRGAVKWMVIVTGVMLVLQQFFDPMLTAWLGLIPARVLQERYVWQLATYMFLHGGIFHWLFNMFILWMFGRELEVRWGTAYFVRYFFITGIGAALCVLALSPHSQVPTIGASGAIFGLLVAFAMVFPEATLYLYFLIPVKAWQAAFLFGFIELFAGIQGGGSALARVAHLGGMLTGYIYLRFSGPLAIRTAPFLRSFSRWGRKIPLPRRKKNVEFYEVTDDLVHEVDRILDKILKKGPDSLSQEEKIIMDRYSKLKH